MSSPGSDDNLLGSSILAGQRFLVAAMFELDAVLSPLVVAFEIWR